MIIHKNFDDYFSEKPLALSLGMFDGVHKGHQSIMSSLRNSALEKNLESAILSFWPHPRMVLNPNDSIKLLNTLEEKSNLLKQIGLNHLFLKEFNESFRNLTGIQFIEQILVERLNVKHLIVGYDHVFGKDKSGNFELLASLSSKYGYTVEKMEAVNAFNYTISSTKIRNFLLDGSIYEANNMLGYFYEIEGKVIHGKKIGRTIGFPTANISIDPIKLLPKKGAYIVEVYIEDKFYKGMLSIGTNPTVGGDTLSTEVYILNFDKDIYDQQIRIRFRDFLHEEIKFENLEKLIKRLNEDKRITEHYSF